MISLKIVYIINLLLIIFLTSSICINISTRSNSYVFSDLPESDESIETMLNEVEEIIDLEDNKSDEVSNNKSNGIQFMITNRMRNTLISELGYLSEEVDELEPQIASVIIDRHLVRPLNGMPTSWKRKDYNSISNLNHSKLFNGLNNISKSIANVFNNIINFIKSKSRILFPLLLSIATIGLLKLSYDNNFNNIFNNLTIFNKNNNKSSSIPKKLKINTKLLRKLQEPNILDHIKVNLDIFKNKYF